MKKILLYFYVLSGFFSANAQTFTEEEQLVKTTNADSAKTIIQLLDEGKLLSKSDTAAALFKFRQVLERARRQKDGLSQAKAFYEIGEIYFTHRIYNRSLPNYSRATDLFYEWGTDKDRALACLGIAKAQYYRGNYSRSATNFVEAVKFSEKNNLPAIKSEANEYLGLIYSAFQNFQFNTGFYKKSIEAKREFNDENGIIRVAGSLSDIYYQQGKYDSALLYAEMSLKYADKQKGFADIYMARFRKAFSLIRLKKMAEADNELYFFEHTSEQKQDANLHIRYQTLLGNYYLSKNDPGKAQEHYTAALSVVKQNSFPELLLIVYEEMAGSYMERGDLQKAYDCYKKYNRQLAKFYTGDNITKLANLEGLVTLESSKDEIKHLNNENRLKALELQNEQNLRKHLLFETTFKDSMLKQERLLSEALVKENKYKEEKLTDETKLHNSTERELLLQKEKLLSEQRLRWYAFAGLGIFVVLGSVIFFLYKRQKRKSAIILKQSEELQTLMKEIHHRVKNNLQVISSLLDLQSLSIKDKQAAGAVKEGKLRVQSMALIHQNLYNEGNIKGILMKDYIRTLTENLFRSYNTMKEKIKLIPDIDELNLDVDTVIPLGLIINELISNSLKYAFKEKENGEIHISLKEKNKELQLEVKDNGVGFPASLHREEYNSFGFKLIKAFTKKLKARMDIFNNNGANVVITFSKYKTAQV